MDHVAAVDGPPKNLASGSITFACSLRRCRTVRDVDMESKGLRAVASGSECVMKMKVWLQVSLEG